MNFCTKCGNALAAGESFCTKCGAPFSSAGNGIMGPSAGLPYTPGPVKKRGHKKIIIPLVVLIVLALGAGTVFGFPYVKTAVTKMIMPPEKYFNNVVDNSINNFSKRISAFTENVKERNAPNQSFTNSIDISLGDQFVSYIDDLMDLDLASEREYIDWIKSIRIDATQNIDDSNLDLKTMLSINNSNIMSCNSLMNFDSGNVYFTIPDINPTALMVNLNDEGIYDDDFSIDKYYKMFNSIPDKDVVEDLIHDYVMTAVDEIQVVDKQREDISVGTKTQSCTALTAQIDTQTYQNMIRAVLSKAKDDAVLMNVIQSFAYQLGIDQHEVYNEFVSGIDDILQNEIDYYTVDGTAAVKLLVNGKGGLVGVIINEGTDQFKFVNIVDKTANEAELSMQIDGESLAVNGGGGLKGTKYDGKYTLSYNNGDVISFSVSDVNALKLKDGYFEGTIMIDAGAYAKNELSSDDLGMLADSQLRYTISESSKDKTDGSIALVYNGSDIITFNTSLEKTAGCTVDPIPASYIPCDDDSAVESWYMSGNYNVLLDNLEAAGANGNWFAPLRSGL